MVWVFLISIPDKLRNFNYLAEQLECVWYQRYLEYSSTLGVLLTITVVKMQCR